MAANGRLGNTGSFTGFYQTGSLAQTAVGAATTATANVTVTDAEVGDHVSVNFAAAATIPAGLGIAFSRVTATDTIQIGFFNTTAGSLNIPAQTIIAQLNRDAP